MKMTKQSHLFIRLQNALFYVLFLLIVGLLAWLGKTYHKSIDLTAGKRNSLSESTQILLSRIDKPIKMVAYIPDDATIHVALKKLVAKYQRLKKDISLEIVNPELDPERAKADGINYSGQVLIKLGSRSETIDSVEEQKIVNVLQRLSRDKPRVIIFLEGHQERSALDTKSSGFSQMVGVLENKGFSFQPHNLIRTQNIPQDAIVLVIAAPKKDYLEAEVKIIQDFIDKGGNLLWLHDPVSATGSDENSPLHALDDIEKRLGLEIQEGTLVDANQDLQAMLGISHPAAIPVIDYSDIEITTDLSAHTLFPFATAILQDALNDSKQGWQYTPLLSTLLTSWLETGEVQGNVKFDEGEDKPGPLTMGMVLTRSINPNQNDQSEKQTTTKEKEKQQRIIVIGDSDFMSNSFIGQGSNLEFASNIFNWLSQDDDLLSIKPTGASDTRLEMSKNQLYTSAIFFLLVLPLGLFVFGLVRWLRRNKR